MDNSNFKLHYQLLADTIKVCELKLSILLLMKQKGCVWFILVPKKDGIREIFELSDEESMVLMEEIRKVSSAVNKSFKADKINVAALGNVVPQLHVHIIARFINDVAWPKPVFGLLPNEFYTEKEANEIIEKIKREL